MVTVPCFFLSAALVMIFIVPPTEAMASLDAPKPLCTCNAEVTSEIPAQLDQYTFPPSISFTGIPFTITAIFSLAKPLILILESPKPPPDLVAYTDGVVLRTSGNSWFPSFSTIAPSLIVETATGVFLSLAMSATPTITTSSMALDEVVCKESCS